MPTDKGRKYQTFNKYNKTKTEINQEYYFKYIKNMNYKPEYEFKKIIEEDVFFEMKPNETKN